MTMALKDVLNTLRTPTNKVCFLVSYVYFKAKKRFYGGKFLEQDIEYASCLLDINIEKISLSSYSRKIRLEHEITILNISGYRSFDKKNIDEYLNDYVYLQVKCYKSPRLIFTEIVDYMLLHKIALPRYRQFVNLISNQIQRYKSDIQEILRNNLDSDTRHKLDDLIQKGDDEYYALRFLKRYNQSLSPANIRENLEDFTRIKALYALIEKPFKSLNLSHEGAMYLTRFVERNRALHLSQRTDDTRHVSLITFISYQYFKGHDILADILLQSVQNIKNSVREEIKNQRAENYTEQNHTFRNTVVEARSCLVPPLEQIISIASDADLNPNECLLKIRQVLESQKLPIESCCNNLLGLENSLQKVEQDNVYYSTLEIKSRKLQNRVTGIIKLVEFTGKSDLIEAIDNFKERDITENTAPVGFLSDKELKHLKDDKVKFRVSLYKALLFLKIAEALKSGNLSLPYSYKYRHLNDYLIPEELWKAKRDDYIKQAGLENLVDIEQLLSASKKELKSSYKAINELIIQEKTPYIKCRKDGSFIVKTPKLESKETYSISSILPYKKDIPIQNVLSVISQQTSFTKHFIHDTPSMQNHNPEDNALFAALIAYGCNVGISRMARITKGHSQSALENISRQYMHIDNIKRANDDVIKKIDEIADCFISSDLRHTSSDGQKYNIDGCSLNANSSYKYHGSGKGVSSYTFLDNRFVHFYATVISSSEREACYVLDGMMNNPIVKSDVHSTDTHGFTETVFALMHMMGITFAPRLKNLSKQTLYGFKTTAKVNSDFVTPQKYINVDVIKQDWDDIMRFASTIKLNYASSSQLFKRLNSYSKQHTLYRALKEFGRLRKTLFILHYMQDMDFRQAIEKQLNRGENSNKFSKAIAFGNNQEIMFEEKEQQEIAENCRQLIKNSIILWNYLYLIRLLQSDDPAKRQHALITLQKGNVLAWKHILLHGEYDLTPENNQDEFALADPKIVNLLHTKFWEEEIT